MSFKKLRSLTWVAVLIPISLVLLFAYNNCSRASLQEGGGSSAIAVAGTMEEQELLAVLTKASTWAGMLSEYSDDESVQIAADVEARRAKILDLVQVQRLPINHPSLIKEVDLLIVAIGEAQFHLLEIDIGRVERESKDRDRDLQGQIDQLSAALNTFKSQVNARFATVEGRITALESRVTMLDTMLAEYRSSSEAADLALRRSLNDLKRFTETQIIDLRNMNNDLKAQIIAQKSVLDELFVSNAQFENLNTRLCVMDNGGANVDSRPACTGNESDLYSRTDCCLTVDNVRCDVLFPSEVQGPARTQCSLLVATIKNHSAQLQEIREVDERQTELISGLLEAVENLNNQVSILTAGYELLAGAINAIVDKIDSMDQRLLITEFKASRAEAVAAINERADLNLAWIARRQGDVSSRFCSYRVRQSLGSFDYEAARQNHEYCKERLEFLRRAHELTQLAKAYASGLSSVNVDTACTATIAGTPAEQLSVEQMVNPEIFRQIQNQCTTGGAVVAKALMFNVVALLNVVGPDFRTVSYMNKKARVAQLVFFGKLISETSADEKAKFELVDPTDPSLSRTLYSRIERVFKKRYVERRLRTAFGAFPEEPAAFPEFIAGFNDVYSLAEINTGSGPYFERLRPLEAPGACAECGFRVVGRNNVDRGGKERFQYPKDNESLCPIIDDVVVMKHADNKLYPYVLNYSSFVESLRPFLNSRNQHAALAATEADGVNGLFGYSGSPSFIKVNRNGLGFANIWTRGVLTVTQPWGRTFAGRGSCLKFGLDRGVRAAEYKAPTNWAPPAGWTPANVDLGRFMSGYRTDVVQSKCEFNMGAGATVREIPLPDSTRALFRMYSPTADQASLDLRGLINAGTTQLTGRYWMTRDRALNYGVNNQMVSSANPFFGAETSHGDRFIRALRQMTEANVKVQECAPPAET